MFNIYFDQHGSDEEGSTTCSVQFKRWRLVNFNFESKNSLNPTTRSFSLLARLLKDY